MLFPPAEPGWAAPHRELATLVGFAALIGCLAYLVMAVLPTTTPAAVRSATRQEG